MHEVLADHRVERCAVVEIEQALVDWMRDGTVPHGPALLADERVHVVVADIAVALAEAPPGVVRPGAARRRQRSRATWSTTPTRRSTSRRSSSRPRGRCVPAARWSIWSAAEAPELEERMRGSSATPRPGPHDVLLQERDEQYWLYVARVPSEA